LNLYVNHVSVNLPLDDQIATLNHIFAQNGVFLEVYGVFGDKGGELQLGYG